MRFFSYIWVGKVSMFLKNKGLLLLKTISCRRKMLHYAVWTTRYFNYLIYKKHCEVVKICNLIQITQWKIQASNRTRTCDYTWLHNGAVSRQHQCCHESDSHSIGQYIFTNEYTFRKNSSTNITNKIKTLTYRIKTPCFYKI